MMTSQNAPKTVYRMIVENYHQTWTLIVKWTICLAQIIHPQNSHQESSNSQMSSVSDPSENEHANDYDIQEDKISCGSADAVTLNLGDELPLAFLQLQGISIGNFNMGCNFQIEAVV
jgi:hypothetical protein